MNEARAYPLLPATKVRNIEIVLRELAVAVFEKVSVFIIILFMKLQLKNRYEAAELRTANIARRIFDSTMGEMTQRVDECQSTGRRTMNKERSSVLTELYRYEVRAADGSSEYKQEDVSYAE